jgi:hypothetical protein
MTEEREHNPAPARTPRFCEGRVLSALAVIAVRSPMHSPRPCSHLGTFSSLLFCVPLFRAHSCFPAAAQCEGQALLVDTVQYR